MKKLRDVTDKVKSILADNEQARNDDNVLYLHVLRKCGEEKGIDIDSMSIPMFFLHCKDFNLPNYKSVERARRRIQELHPELASNDDTQRAKDEQEMKYEKFAREVF
jgi:hypothetical protein